MRILANYGYKANGDSYSVTFETMGDVPKERAEAVVDELFELAKSAIQRQLNPQADPLDFPPEDKKEVTIPKPVSAEKTPEKKSADTNNGKPKIKDPSAPATKKQKSFIVRLAKEKGQFIENINGFTMQEASEAIEELMAV